MVGGVVGWVWRSWCGGWRWLLSPWADYSLRSECEALGRERARLSAENELLIRQVEFLSYAHDVNNKMLDEMAYTHGVKSSRPQ